MTTLRWLLGLSSALMAVACVALIVITSGFRSSFGASPKGTFGGTFVTLLLLAILAAAIAPGQRWLLHFAAVLAGLAAIGALAIVRESIGTALFALAYLGLFFAYYWQVAWRGH